MRLEYSEICYLDAFLVPLACLLKCACRSSPDAGSAREAEAVDGQVRRIEQTLLSSHAALLSTAPSVVHGVASHAARARQKQPSDGQKRVPVPLARSGSGNVDESCGLSGGAEGEASCAEPGATEQAHMLSGKAKVRPA